MENFLDLGRKGPAFSVWSLIHAPKIPEDNHLYYIVRDNILHFGITFQSIFLNKV